MDFFVGYHQPGRADDVDRPVMISANRLRGRKSDFPISNEWMLDSGAYTQIANEAGFYSTPAEYAIAVARWSRCGDLVAAASQDYLCNPSILSDLDTNIREHQERTVERYDEIRRYLDRIGCDTYLLPTLQGWTPGHYARHITMYGDRLGEGAWVGVGSIASRSDNPADIQRILDAITRERGDLRLHGFGLKGGSLKRKPIRDALYSADSMAWSYAARKGDGDPNSPIAAREFYDELAQEREATPLFAG